jgi:hypothetical protein
LLRGLKLVCHASAGRDYPHRLSSVSHLGRKRPFLKSLSSLTRRSLFIPNSYDSSGL